ncbi:uncharacterized protein F5147DRAFT_658280 [Suillus discolor]|uniref:Uncharacterized protein n=1 Tax=Suillus discolor TaxID=1912936 RepID=A0A9P7JMS6_9AGAM|nr:uncharacterized protein F5147DRAFT_658280 [Suillus discolor]KAG2090017.1 hypothetical protein F5147DRAFT_658280 [Suillus discolor]
MPPHPKFNASGTNGNIRSDTHQPHIHGQAMRVQTARFTRGDVPLETMGANLDKSSRPIVTATRLNQQVPCLSDGPRITYGCLKNMNFGVGKPGCALSTAELLTRREVAKLGRTPDSRG